MAEDYIGKILLIGLTYLDANGKVERLTQVAGTIVEASDLTIAIDIGKEEPFTLPPDYKALIPAKPGIYCLKTGEEIHNPDFTTVWTIQAPKK